MTTNEIKTVVINICNILRGCTPLTDREIRIAGTQIFVSMINKDFERRRKKMQSLRIVYGN